jgi:methylmalonyl-CoA mutase
MGVAAPAEPFPTPTREAWRTAAQAVLKGASFDTTMRWHSADGLVVEAVHERAQGRVPIAGRSAGTRWRLLQRVEHPDPAEANALLLADLRGGAEGAVLTFAGAPSARGFALSAEGPALAQMLAEVELDKVALRLEPGPAAPQAVAALIAFAERSGLSAGRLDIAVGHDPIGLLAAQGCIAAGWAREVVGLTQALADAGHEGPALTADGRPYHEAGASQAQELAGVIATALAYLRVLEKGGFALETARRRIDFVLAADVDIFLTMAKHRSLRLLWARVEAACGLEARPLRLHAETSWRMATTREGATNILRGTIACFAAGLGGADSVALLPLSIAQGLPDAFARRVARNAQHILMEEANLHRVGDPAAGSGAIETLTDGLCAKAWAIVQTIERHGGMVEMLASGALQAQIAGVRAAAPEAPIVGTTEFASPRDEEPAILDVAATTPPVRAAPEPGATLAQALASVRAAAPFDEVPRS